MSKKEYKEEIICLIDDINKYINKLKVCANCKFDEHGICVNQTRCTDFNEWEFNDNDNL